MDIKILIFSILLLNVIKAEENLVKSKILKDGQGLRFEKVGEMKLIVEHHQLTFTVDSMIIEKLLNEIDTSISYCMSTYPTDDKFKIKLKSKSRRVKELRDIFNDIFNHESTTRNKRSIPMELLPAVSVNSGNALVDNLCLISSGIDQTGTYLNTMKDELNTLINVQMQTLADLTKQTMLNELEAKLYEAKTKIRGILTMQQQERLSSMFVSLENFERERQNIEHSFKGSTTKQLPYKRRNEYYYNLKLSHSVEGKKMILSVDVPVVEKATRTLYKIHEIPSKNDQQNFLIPDVKWKYIANGTQNVALLETLEPCLKGTKANMFFCVSKSPVISTSATFECLVNALQNEYIDFESCKTKPSMLKKLTFIKLGNGEYFYFAPKGQKHEILAKCDNTTEELELEEELGILTLQKGCTVETEKYKILSTRTYKQSVASSFDIGYKGQSRDQIKAFLEIPAYINDIHEISKPIYLTNDEYQNEMASRNWIIGGVLIVVGLCVALLIIIKVKMSKNKKEDDKQGLIK